MVKFGTTEEATANAVLRRCTTPLRRITLRIRIFESHHIQLLSGHSMTTTGRETRSMTPFRRYWNPIAELDLRILYAMATNF